MRRFFRVVTVLGFLVTTTTNQLALAQSPSPLRGKWNIVISSPAGSILLLYTLKRGGKGKVKGGLVEGAVAYRAMGSEFSITAELRTDGLTPTDTIPIPSTVVLRGTRTPEDSLIGVALIVSNREDAGGLGG